MRPIGVIEGFLNQLFSFTAHAFIRQRIYPPTHIPRILQRTDTYFQISSAMGLIKRMSHDRFECHVDQLIDRRSRQRFSDRNLTILRTSPQALSAHARFQILEFQQHSTQP